MTVTLRAPIRQPDADLPRPVTNTLKMLFLGPVSAICCAVAVILYFGSPWSAVFFAWTTVSPLTAATMGAAFFAAMVLFASAGLEYRWADARLAALAPLPLLPMMLWTSIAGHSRFHFFGSPIVGMVVAVLWLIAFTLLPLVLGLALFGQFRYGHGRAAPRAVPIPLWARNLVELLAVSLLFNGIVFFAAPGTFVHWWPWPVDVLDLRALSTWSTTFGFAILLGVWEDDLDRVRCGLAALLTFGVLELGAILWHHSALVWSRPGAWAFVTVTVAILVAGATGFRLAGLPTTPPER